MSSRERLAVWGLGACLALGWSTGCATKSEAARADSSVANAPSAPEARAQAQALLSASTPVEAGKVKAMGPAALDPLAEAASDGKRTVPERQRAVEALAYVGNPGADSALQALIANPNLVLLLRAEAMRSFALRAGPTTLSVLKPYLSADPSEVRIAAAGAVAILGSSEARQALEDRLAEESNEGVREALQQSLSKAEP